MKYKYENKDLNDAYNDGYSTAQKEVMKVIENFNFGYDYNRDCQIKERLKKVIGEKL